VQRIACLYITGATRTALTAALELVIGITPVMVYLEQEALAACLRLKLNSQRIQTHTGGHTSICSRLHSNVPLSQQTVDRIMPKFIFDKNYSVFIPARKDWTYDEVVLNDNVICYMDGSRFEHIGTSEVLLPLGHNTSVFQAEVYAIAQCAKMENLLHRNNSSITIC